uniref:Uncharacterized protein n=1 Tax=Solanum lycopersicum TaxID=4081 RepID=A0A3Q7HJB6_SOLLC
MVIGIGSDRYPVVSWTGFLVVTPVRSSSCCTRKLEAKFEKIESCIDGKGADPTVKDKQSGEVQLGKKKDFRIYVYGNGELNRWTGHEQFATQVSE